jgi:hypothetical protein
MNTAIPFSFNQLGKTSSRMSSYEIRTINNDINAYYCNELYGWYSLYRTIQDV